MMISRMVRLIYFSRLQKLAVIHHLDPPPPDFESVPSDFDDNEDIEDFEDFPDDSDQPIGVLFLLYSSRINLI